MSHYSSKCPDVIADDELNLDDPLDIEREAFERGLSGAPLPQWEIDEMVSGLDGLV